VTAEQKESPMLRPALILIAAAPALAGCLSMSRSETVAPLSANLTRDARIERVEVKRNVELKVTDEFDELFKRHVKAKLDACAKGTQPLVLVAELDRLSKANPVVTAAVAGANVLRGSAQLVDPATGQVVADYKVGKTIVGSRFAVVVMGEAEEQLSDAFGDEMCKQAFPAPASP
jgi:hypothetical protein